MVGPEFFVTRAGPNLHGLGQPSALMNLQAIEVENFSRVDLFVKFGRFFGFPALSASNVSAMFPSFRSQFQQLKTSIPTKSLNGRWLGLQPRSPAHPPIHIRHASRRHAQWREWDQSDGAETGKPALRRLLSHTANNHKRKFPRCANEDSSANTNQAGGAWQPVLAGDGPGSRRPFVSSACI